MGDDGVEMERKSVSARDEEERALHGYPRDLIFVVIPILPSMAHLYDVIAQIFFKKKKKIVAKVDTNLKRLLLTGADG